MKKTITLLLAMSMLLGASALAVSREDAQSAAQARVGAGATLVESDRDDGYYEFEFSDDAARYDVLVDEQSGEVVMQSIEYRGMRKASSAAVDEAAARQAVTEAAPEAQIHYVLLEQDDGAYEWNLFYTDGEDAVIASVQAESGEIRQYEIYYGAAAEILTADQAVEALTASRGTMEILELDLDLDEDTGTLRYDGNARVDGRVYEFEMTAAHGDIVKWERD